MVEEFNEYQIRALRYAIFPKEQALTYLALGLVGEAGEVAEKVKKKIRDDKWEPEEVIKELGDVLWYLSALANTLGYDLDEVASLNIEKLESRLSRNKLSGDGDNR